MFEKTVYEVIASSPSVIPAQAGIQEQKTGFRVAAYGPRIKVRGRLARNDEEVNFLCILCIR